jgi:NAD(P)-dependent dehydrogenase (short-subunit alcohol dehydrogenase family)
MGLSWKQLDLADPAGSRNMIGRIEFPAPSQVCVNPKAAWNKFHAERSDYHMSQKIAFITGGNRGLGFQTAIEIKDAGVKVVIGSRNLAHGEQAVAKLRAAGVDADVLQFDITKASDAQAAYDYFNSHYGHLDILVNNAGIAAGTFPGTGPEHSATQVPADLLHKVFETNFLRR